jgi:shikimate kinase / 3-dehydroquinate synthase
MADRALVLIGFMGAGKSTLARAAAAAGEPVVEADELVEGELGMPIGEFFAANGEEEFRAVEERVVGELLEGPAGGVVALGGGSLGSPRVAEALRRHRVAWLQVDAAEAWKRVEASDRPLARERAAFDSLLAERSSLYEAAAGAVVMPSRWAELEQLLPILLAWRDSAVEPRFLWAASESGSYPVLVGRGVIGSAGGRAGGRAFCITDRAVGPLYGGQIGDLAGTVEVEPGEQAKTLAEAERVLARLAEQGMTRGDHIIALGGGVVGDLAGFCAHTYQRGVPVVQVPTTVVAQVDSAYGGKTGVDLAAAKNYVGAYHLPAAVIADTATLATLPEQEVAAGMVEVLKTGLLAGGSLWERVSGARGSLDERDSGRRMILNLGHTVGHAIEAATGYGRYRHGEAVGLGLLAALRLSGAERLREEVSGLLAGFGAPLRLDPAVEVEAVIEAIQRDKKRTAEGVPFVLLERPGEPREGQLLDLDSVRAAVMELAG